MKLSPFFRCSACQRLHTRANVSQVTNCLCGVSLWAQVFSRPAFPKSPGSW